jgi:hypothetical protein
MWNKPCLLCRQLYLHAFLTDAVLLVIFRSGRLPDPPLTALPGHPDHLAPANLCADSICTWCHSLRSDLFCPWSPGCTLSIVCSSTLPAAQGAIPFPNSVYKLLLLTSGWPCFHCRLDVPITD